MKERCQTCYLPVALCLCEGIAPRTIPLKLSMLMHYRETMRLSNTGHLMGMAFSPCTLHEYGRKGQDFPLKDIDLTTSAILYPDQDSIPISQSEGLAHLIVPDGNWRQAHKISRRLKAMGLKTVSFSSTKRSEYQLRRHTNPEFICTAEAVFEALAELNWPQREACISSGHRLFLRYRETVQALRGKRPGNRLQQLLEV